MKRVSHEPAYVLHRYDWSESSLILETFTRHHGRIALVAKGAKRPSSNFRPVLLPLQPLQLNFSGDAEIRTLKGAEWMGGHVMPTGEALLSGYYVNELLLRLLARDDPHEALFDAYAAVVQVLASDHAGAQAATQSAALRAFELLLLREVGLLPTLDAADAHAGAAGAGRALCAGARSRPARSGSTTRPALQGADWQALQAALDDRAPFAATLRACAGINGALRTQLRDLAQLPLRRCNAAYAADDARPASPMSPLKSTALSVNLNKVALVRNTRPLGIPSVLFAAALCLDAGAHGITVHPRPDERHIRPQDVRDLSALLRKDWPAAEFNIEGNPFHNLMEFVRELRPHQATFVPDSETQSTSDHGWSFPEDAERLRPLIAEARALGVRVSLFMDPDPEMMAAAKAVGADRVELYTEGYARLARHRARRERCCSSTSRPRARRRPPASKSTPATT